jgi:intein-encoded DNA endonuclease-like protein
MYSSGALFTRARLLNRLIVSTLIDLEFKDLRWLEYIEIFLKQRGAEQP